VLEVVVPRRTPSSPLAADDEREPVLSGSSGVLVSIPLVVTPP
jgi:hypothetical protein